MSSNGDMSDPDSSSLEPNINLDPAIAASVHPDPERVVHKCKEYIRRPGIRDDAKSDFPTLHLWAFDILAVPAMSAECERMFSSVKKLVSPERNRLHERVIEASECLKNWWDRGLIIQRPHAPEDDDSDACDLEEDDCGL
jgi:hypothetical protein